MLCFAGIKARLAPRIRGNVFRKMETPNIAIGGELSGELCVVVGGTLQSEALGTESEEQSVRVIINILQTSDLHRVVTMAG